MLLSKLQRRANLVDSTHRFLRLQSHALLVESVFFLRFGQGKRRVHRSVLNVFVLLNLLHDHLANAEHRGT